LRELVDAVREAGNQKWLSVLKAWNIPLSSSSFSSLTREFEELKVIVQFKNERQRDDTYTREVQNSGGILDTPDANQKNL